MASTILSVFQWTSSTERSVTTFDIRSCPQGITPVSYTHLAGNYGKNVNYAAGKGAGIAGAAGGAVGGFAGGHGKQVLHSAGHKAKEVAGQLFRRRSGNAPE